MSRTEPTSTSAAARTILGTGLLAGLLMNIFGWLGNQLWLGREWDAAIASSGFSAARQRTLWNEVGSLAPDFVYGIALAWLCWVCARALGSSRRISFGAAGLLWLVAIATPLLGTANASLVPWRVTLLTLVLALVIMLPVTELVWRRVVRLAVLVAFLSAPVQGQEVRRGFIGLDIGPSQPIGAFARESNAPGAGNARAGYTSTLLNISWRRTDRWAVAGLFAYSEYFMHNTDDIDDDWWQVAFVTAGPMYTIPLNAKAAVDLKGTLGLAALTPVINSSASNNDTGAGLAIDLRATIRHDVFRRWAVFAEVGLQSANVSFSSGGGQQYRALISGFGIAFRPEW